MIYEKPNEPRKTTIQIDDVVRDLLKDEKVHPRESYNDAIKRIITKDIESKLNKNKNETI